MVNPSIAVNDISHVIQLALTPVFLLTGIAGILNVMTGRLARIIDRGRQISEREIPFSHPDPYTLQREADGLDRRRHLTSVSITSCTLSALLVCTVIAMLFLEVLLGFDLKWIVGLLFTGSTLALVVGLAYFLREVHLATTTVRIPSLSGK